MRNFIYYAFCLGMGVVIYACSDTSFKSNAEKKNAAQDDLGDPTGSGDGKVDKTLRLACTDSGGEAHLVTDVSGTKSTTVRLEGEFCGVSSATTGGALNVLFILDYSNSMEINDPEVGGSCGRLRAGEALLNKLQGTSGAAGLKVGLLAFGDEAFPGVAPQSVAAFKQHLSTREFCDTNGGATNYEAAFAAARTMLAKLKGPKVIYFISDGLPTRAGTAGAGIDPLDPRLDVTQALEQIYAAGKQAATDLRAQVAAVTLNAIFLGNKQGDINIPGFTSPDPQNYLQEITGSAARVRVVTSANDLAAKIKTFEDPKTVALDAASAAGQLSAASFGNQVIKLASVESDPSRAGVWRFVTEPFVLYGKEGTGAVANIVTLKISGADGKTYTASAEINFTVGTAETP